MKPSTPTILLLVGPSCSGKTTLEKALVAKGAASVISNTTRLQRSGEVDGVDYHFRSPEWFEKTKAAGEFVELVKFSGNQYGNTIKDLKEAFAKSQNGIIAWVVEPQGLKQIKTYFETSDLPAFLYAAFIDGDEDKRLERFAGRVMADIDVQRSLHAAKARLQSAFGRVKTMTTTERGWVQEAHESMKYDAGLYNCIIKRFDETNQADVVEFLCNITAIRRFSDEVAKAAREGLLHENALKLAKTVGDMRREAIMATEGQVSPKESVNAEPNYTTYRKIFGFNPTCDASR
jgi:guanylate kinase